MGDVPKEASESGLIFILLLSINLVKTVKLSAHNGGDNTVQSLIFLFTNIDNLILL